MTGSLYLGHSCARPVVQQRNTPKPYPYLTQNKNLQNWPKWPKMTKMHPSSLGTKQMKPYYVASLCISS